MKHNQTQPNTTNFFKKDLPSIYRAGYFEVALFNYINAKVEEGKTIIQAVEDFRKRHGLDESSAPLGTCDQIYRRMAKVFKIERGVSVDIKYEMIDSKVEILEAISDLRNVLIKEMKANEQKRLV